MGSQPATMTMASTAGATPIHSGLPEEIVVWEILVRLPPKALLRCRAVCRAWRHATSTRDFLHAHHGCQPNLPVVFGYKHGGAYYEDYLAFDHRAAGAQLQLIFTIERSFYPVATCDGLLILSNHGKTGLSVCNPATRQHAPLRQLSGFTLSGMYPHRPTGEYRLLVQQIFEEQISYYVFALGSSQLPRYIGGLETAPSTDLPGPALVRDSLHWFPVHNESFPELNLTGSKVVIVFDTTSESFRHMRAPVVPARSYIFEMDGTLGIYNYNRTTQIVDIWMLQNYESEVWGHKYSVRLPAVEIKERFRGWLNDDLYVSVDLVDGEVLLLVTQDGWMYHVDTDGKLVDNFGLVGQNVYACALRLKQTLVQHTFFAGLEGYDVNGSPFVLTALQ